MQNFTCFLINLDKDKDRLLHMDQQLHSAGISYQRTQAIYGKEYEFSIDEYDENLCREKNKQPMSRAELGCALSHRNIYEKITTDGVEYALILEDDVEIPGNFKTIVNDEIHKNKSTWEYLSFDYYAYGFSFIKLWINGVYSIFKSKHGGKKVVFLFSIIAKSFLFLPLSVLEELQKVVFKNSSIKTLRPIYFAGCYVVTITAAKKLLTLSSPLLYPADRLPNVARIENKLKFRIYTPLLVRQLKATFTSNIAPTTTP